MTARVATVAFMGAALVLAGSARAESNDVPTAPFHFVDRPLTLDAVVGAGSPVGLLGAVIQYDLLDEVSVGAGAGVNLNEPEYAALLRFRPFTWSLSKRALAIEIGTAFSASHYEGQLADVASLAGEGGVTRYTQKYNLDLAYWAQFDVGFEMKARSGFHLVAAPGFALPLNPGDGRCTDDATGHPVECQRGATPTGQRPEPIPLVVTVVVGVSRVVLPFDKISRAACHAWSPVRKLVSSPTIVDPLGRL